MKKIQSFFFCFIVGCGVVFCQNCPDGYYSLDTTMLYSITSNRVPFESSSCYYRYKSTTWSVYSRYDLENLGITPGSIIKGIGYYLSSDSPYNVPKVGIYMKEQPMASINSVDDTVSLSDMTLVYYSDEMSFLCGWNNIQLDSAFTYRGIGNVIVAVHRDSCRSSSYRSFRCHMGKSVTRYIGQSQTEYSSQLIGARPALIFNVCAGTPDCTRPSNLMLASTDSSVTVSYVSSASLFHVRVVYEGVDPDSVSQGYLFDQYSTQNTATVYGLDAGVVYDVYVRGICGTDTTLWSQPGKVRTNCGMQMLPYESYFSDAESVDSCYVLHGAQVQYDGTIVGTDSSQYSMIVLPEFDSPLNKLHIKINKTNLLCDSVFIGSVPNPYDTNVFVPYDTIVFSGAGSRETDFRQCTDMTGRLAIKFRTARFDCLFVDTLLICYPIYDLSLVESTDSSLSVTWQEQGNAIHWLVESVSNDGSDYRVTTVDTNAITLTGLQQYTNYYISVRAINQGDTSISVQGRFRTGLDSRHTIVVEQLGQIVAGNGYSSQCPISRWNKNSWNQHVYTMYDYVVEGLIDTIWFNCRTANPSVNDTSVTVYMTHVDRSYNYLDDSWIPFDSLKVVYHSSEWPSTHATGWVPLVLDTPFYYNGTDNFVMTFARSGSSTFSSNNDLFYTFYEPGGTRLHYYTNNASGVNYPTSVSINEFDFMPVMRLSMMTRSCLHIDSLSIEVTDCRSVSLSWIERGDAQQWQIHYVSIDEEVEGTVVVDDFPYGIINNLPNNHTYTFSVRPICGEGDTGYYFGSAKANIGMDSIDFYIASAVSGNPDLGFVEINDNESQDSVICPGMYSEGSQLTFTATSYDEHTVFAGWSDGDMSNPRTITLTQDTVLKAFFVRYYSAYAISDNPVLGTAYISVDDGQYDDNGCQGLYPEGTQLLFSAVPIGENSVFVGWNDGDISNPKTIILVQDTSFIAYFNCLEDVTTVDDDKIRVMPNPASDNVFIVAESLIEEIRCFDAMGREVYVFKPNQNSWTIDVSNWPLGVYVMSVVSSKVKQTTKLIVVDR